MGGRTGGGAGERRRRWERIAVVVSAASIVWNLGEAGAGLYVGLLHGELSLSIFAAQSLVEVLSASMVLWRLLAVDINPVKGTPQDALIRKERVGTRAIGFLFLVFATAVIIDASFRLATRATPSEAFRGLIISGCSWSMMLAMYVVKRRASQVLNSPVLLQDAKCSLMCMGLSSIVIASSGMWYLRGHLASLCHHHAICRFWYLDSVLAILLACIIFRDGVRAVKASYSPGFIGGCSCCSGAAKKAGEYDVSVNSGSIAAGHSLLSTSHSKADGCCGTGPCAKPEPAVVSVCEAENGGDTCCSGGEGDCEDRDIAATAPDTCCGSEPPAAAAPQSGGCCGSGPALAPVTPAPSEGCDGRYVAVANMVDTGMLADDAGFAALLDEVSEEAGRFGTVVEIVLPRAHGERAAPFVRGEVYLRFARLSEARRALGALDGHRLSASKTVSARMLDLRP